jgi:hypothetical protein
MKALGFQPALRGSAESSQALVAHEHLATSIYCFINETYEGFSEPKTSFLDSMEEVLAGSGTRAHLVGDFIPTFVFSGSHFMTIYFGNVSS